MASLKRSKTLPADAQTVKFLYTILKQLDLKTIDWSLVASQLDISNGHAARMRYSRFRQHLENTPTVPRATKPKTASAKTGSSKGKSAKGDRHPEKAVTAAETSSKKRPAPAEFVIKEEPREPSGPYYIKSEPDNNDNSPELVLSSALNAMSPPAPPGLIPATGNALPAPGGLLEAAVPISSAHLSSSSSSMSKPLLAMAPADLADPPSLCHASCNHNSLANNPNYHPIFQHPTECVHSNYYFHQQPQYPQIPTLHAQDDPSGYAGTPAGVPTSHDPFIWAPIKLEPDADGSFDDILIKTEPSLGLDG